jgi:hypothetical protein
VPDSSIRGELHELAEDGRVWPELVVHIRRDESSDLGDGAIRALADVHVLPRDQRLQEEVICKGRYLTLESHSQIERNLKDIERGKT